MIWQAAESSVNSQRAVLRHMMWLWLLKKMPLIKKEHPDLGKDNDMYRKSKCNIAVREDQMQFISLAYSRHKNPPVVKAEGFSICESGESSSLFVFVFLLMFCLHRCVDEPAEQGVWTVGTALEFRVELHADVEGVIADLHGLYDMSVWRGTADAKAGCFQLVTEVIVEFIAVTVTFVDLVFFITLHHAGAFFDVAWVGA